MKDGLLVSFRSEVSGRTVVISDEGDSVWGYLTQVATLQPNRDCWLFNKPAAPSTPDIGEYRRVRRPPPVPARMIGPAGVRDVPGVDRWSVRWSATGESVAIALDDVEIGVMAIAERSGMSRYLVEPGPWGSPWDEEAIARLLA
jgi:hypothetical protein